MKKPTMALLFVLVSLAFIFAGGQQESNKTFSFWEHFETFTTLNTSILEAQKAEKGIDFEYTVSSPDKMLEALPVAFRSNQLPDIYSMPTNSINSLISMQKEGWFTPLSVKLEELPESVQVNMFEGITFFDGEPYSIPMFSANHPALLFYHPSMVGSDVPETYQEFYESCKKVHDESNGEVYGIILPMTFIDRVQYTFENLMSAAGAPIIDYTTGNYQYDSKEMIALFALFARMWDEGLIHPASVNFNMKEARERWAAGEAAYMFDGIWNVGITKNNFNPDLTDFAVTDPIRPTTGDYMVYLSPLSGAYYIGGTSPYQEEATDILLNMVSADYQVTIANIQDQPPLNLESLELADVHPSYIEGCNIFTENNGFEPTPLLRNTDVAQVSGNMRTITPSLCEILNGYFSGALTDWESALHTYNKAMTAERDAQISKAQAAGYDVSLEDWKFPNFVYGESYTSDKYEK